MAKMDEASDQIPRRCRLELLTTEEYAIRNAIVLVEQLGADPRLTDAVVLLQRRGIKWLIMLMESHIKPLAPVIELESRKPVWCAAYCVCLECGFRCVAVVHKTTIS